MHGIGRGSWLALALLAAVVSCSSQTSGESARGEAGRSSTQPLSSASTTISPPTIPSTTTADAVADGTAEVFDECRDLAPPPVAAVGNLGYFDNPDEAATTAVADYGAAWIDTFGGTWIDRASGGVLVVAVTDDPAPHTNRLAGLLPEAVAFEVVQVDFTQEELLAVQRQFFGDTGLLFESSGFPTDLNRMMFGFTDPGAGDIAAFAELVPVEKVCLEIQRTPPLPEPPLSVLADSETNAAANVAVDPYVRCRSTPRFRLSKLAEPTQLEDVEHPAIDVFRMLINDRKAVQAISPGPWGALDLGDETALFVLLESDGETAVVPITVAVLRRQRSQWTWGNQTSGCELRLALPPGLIPVSWELDTMFPRPEPTATELHLVASEETCATEADFRERLWEPEIRIEDEQVRIAIAAEWWDGYMACSQYTSTKITVQLAEPLGDRQLVDGLRIQ